MILDKESVFATKNPRLSWTVRRSWRHTFQ